MYDLNGWCIYGSNGWGSYFVGGMLKNTGLQGSTLAGPCMTTGFSPFELQTRGLLQKLRCWLHDFFTYPESHLKSPQEWNFSHLPLHFNLTSYVWNFEHRCASGVGAPPLDTTSGTDKHQTRLLTVHVWIYCWRYIPTCTVRSLLMCLLLLSVHVAMILYIGLLNVWHHVSRKIASGVPVRVWQWCNWWRESHVFTCFTLACYMRNIGLKHGAHSIHVAMILYVALLNVWHHSVQLSAVSYMVHQQLRYSRLINWCLAPSLTVKLL